MTFTVTDGETSYTKTVPVEDGKAVYAISDLPNGNYTVTAEFEGEGYYPDSAVDKFSVEMMDSEVEAHAEVDEEGKVSIYATVNDAVTGNLTFIVISPDNQTFLGFNKEIIDGTANEGAPRLYGLQGTV